MNHNNGIIGDIAGTELPQAQIDENELIEEKKMARYAKSGEFKRIQDHFNERISFYQQYLPDGRPVAGATDEDVRAYWKVANLLIAEFNQVINLYENAKEVVGNGK